MDDASRSIHGDAECSWLDRRHHLKGKCLLPLEDETGQRHNYSELPLGNIICGVHRVSSQNANTADFIDEYQAKMQTQLTLSTSIKPKCKHSLTLRRVSSQNANTADFETRQDSDTITVNCLSGTFSPGIGNFRVADLAQPSKVECHRSAKYFLCKKFQTQGPLKP